MTVEGPLSRSRQLFSWLVAISVLSLISFLCGYALGSVVNPSFRSSSGTQVLSSSRFEALMAFQGSREPRMSGSIW
jgi:hypothetical protein